MNPLRDAINILKKDWKMLAGLNALYFCVLVIGVIIALISPGIHLSIIDLIGSDTIAGSAGISETSSALEALQAAGMSFISSFTYTILITIPSIVLPIWGPIIGASKFFVWGVAYAAPLPGDVNLLPQYGLMILQGEAYIIAVLACVRQLSVALASADLGFRRALKEYIKAILDNMKLLVVVVLLLAVAALYQALLVPVLNGFL
jgi:hypothetical protein